MSDAKPEGLSHIYPLYHDMVSNRINYSYRGIFTREVTDGLIEFAQGIFDRPDVEKKLKKRVVYIMVECIQNITRHQEMPENPPQEKEGIFLIQCLKGLYNISQGNLIRNHHIPSLKQKLDRINSMDQAALRKTYKNLLRETSISEKGGAGLGLIEIARRSGNRIGYRFKPVNRQYSFFYMDSLISDTGTDVPAQIDTPHRLDVVDKLLNVLSHNKVNLAYCIHLCGQHAFDLLSIIENFKLIRDNDLLTRKRLFLIIVEMLQNIHHHAAGMDADSGRTGILLIGSDQGTCRITTGNMIRKEDAQKIRDHFDYLNGLDEVGLERAYKKQLSNEDFSDPSRNGLGLLDVRMKSKNLLLYDLYRVGEKHSFLSVQVTMGK